MNNPVSRTITVTTVIDGVNGTMYQRIYKSTNLPTEQTPSGNSPAGWSNVPTAITSTARYRHMSERHSDDGGTTWTVWSDPVVDAYLSEDGTSIAIKGEAKGVVEWGGSLPPTSSAADGDTWLHNDNTEDDIDVYEEDWENPGRGSWDGRFAAMGDGYLISGYLWMKVNNTATATQVRWKNVGLIQGPKGDTGDSAWSVQASRSPLIINQSRSNTSDFGLPIEITFTGMNGNNAATVGSVTVLPNSMGFQITGSTGKITINSYSKVSGSYVTSGTIQCTVPLTYNGVTQNMTVGISVGVNLLGEFKREIDIDIETAMVNAHIYEVDPQTGQIIESSYLYKEVNKATESTTRLERNTESYAQLTEGGDCFFEDADFVDINDVYVHLKAGTYHIYADINIEELPTDTYELSVANFSYSGSASVVEDHFTIATEGNYVITLQDELGAGSGSVNELYIIEKLTTSSELKQTADGITAVVERDYATKSELTITANGIKAEVEGEIPSINLISLLSWTDGTNPLTNGDVKLGKVGTAHDLFSPQIYLEAGTYTFSAFCDNGLCYLKTADSASGTESQTQLTLTATSETYQGMTRYKGTFTLNAAKYVRIGLTIPVLSATITAYRPQLEKGDTMTFYVPSADVVGSTGYVDVKANEVNIGIRQGLNNTGINITNQTINLQADKVTFSDAQGGNTDKIQIDPTTGTMRMVNAVITGATMIDSVKTFDSFGDLTDTYYQNVEIYDLTTYIDEGETTLSKIWLLGNRFIFTLLASRNYSTRQRKLYIHIPPAEFFKGQTILINNGMFEYVTSGVSKIEVWIHVDTEICILNKDARDSGDIADNDSAIGKIRPSTGEMYAQEGSEEWLTNGMFYNNLRDGMLGAIMKEFEITNFEWIELTAWENHYYDEDWSYRHAIEWKVIRWSKDMNGVTINNLDTGNYPHLTFKEGVLTDYTI